VGRQTPQGVGPHAINWHKLASRRRISRSKVSEPSKQQTAAMQIFAAPEKNMLFKQILL